MTRFRLLAAGAGLAILLALPAAASAEPDAGGLFRTAAPVGEDDLGARVAAVGVPRAQPSYRRSPPATGPYRPPALGPTRDQTSPFGLEILVGVMDREVDRSDVRFPFDVESTRLLGKVTFRPASFFEIYGLGGIADLDSPFEDADFDGDFGAAYGGGARLTFFRDPEWYDITVFAEGRYLQFESDASGVLFEAPDPGNPGETILVAADQFFDWREWEGRVGVSWRFYLTRPYLGLRYSDAEADSRVSISPAEFDLRAEDNVGGFVGIDIYFDPDRRIGLNLDLSFPDQTSFQAGLKFWF